MWIIDSDQLLDEMDHILWGNYGTNHEEWWCSKK
jgi:hypothetical protein